MVCEILFPEAQVGHVISSCFQSFFFLFQIVFRLFCVKVDLVFLTLNSVVLRCSKLFSMASGCSMCFVVCGCFWVMFISASFFVFFKM